MSIFKPEKLVQDALETAMKGRTVILIVHRMSTIVNAYMIIVAQNGQVTGTHSNLLQMSEFYSNLFSMQNIVQKVNQGWVGEQIWSSNLTEEEEMLINATKS
ncbi:ABC transporter B family member 19-like protein [Tanacetum coccineum]